MEYYDPKVRGPAAPQGKASVFNTMAAEAQGKAVFLSLMVATGDTQVGQHAAVYTAVYTHTRAHTRQHAARTRTHAHTHASTPPCWNDGGRG